nr:nuclear body protein SP140-like protein [Zootoca vivipara]
MPEHDDVCREDSLKCCSSCPRYFHEDCHIPKISAEKSMSAPGTSDEIFRWFRGHKVQISFAIKDTSPFLPLLRAKRIISEKDFKNWYDKVAAKPNDICKVVCDVLESIQTNVSAIEEIFCKENLDAYPNLQPLYESLENVLQHAQNSSAAEPGCSKVLQGEMKEPESPGEQQRKGMQNNKIQDLNVGVRTLKVRCGRSKGVLYKNRFTAGVSRKCIKGSDGNWFTPLEFKAKGGYKSSKGWRRCIRYGGISLETLIKWGEILKPQPESSRMQKPDDLCAVRCVCCEERGHR